MCAATLAACADDSPSRPAQDRPDAAADQDTSPDQSQPGDDMASDQNTPDQDAPDDGMPDMNAPDDGMPDMNAPDQDQPDMPAPMDPGPRIDKDTAAYVGGTGAERFTATLRLSDGSFLIAGGADDMSWLPAGTPTTQLTFDGLHSSHPGRTAFILHVSADLKTITRAVTLPPGAASEISRMRTTEAPGQPTGLLYISGPRTVASAADDGYFIARLDHNFLTAPPAAARWVYNVSARPRQAAGDRGTSAHKELQPWDVSASGEVVYATGAEYDFRWAAIEKLDADGKQTIVPNWPAHWSATTEWSGATAAEYPNQATDPLVRSAIVMKAGRKGSLRSRTQADFDRLLPDGNGRTDRKGAMPDDYFFTGPCNAQSCPTSGRGYTGYRTSDKTTQRVGGIVIDRRSGDLYFGYSTQSVLPDGNPDFEPAVVAMRPDGTLKWWSRLYHEQVEQRNQDGTPKTDANGATLYHRTSTPDQYVDGLAIDYANDQLVVLARAHGNNVINLWRGDKIADNPQAQGFQNQFTGNNGNIHISWLGKLTLAAGALRHATYVAEYIDGNTRFGQPHPDPNLDGWPNPNGGWPDVHTTRCRGDVRVDAQGRVAILCTGRRSITTATAFQKMLKPGQGSSTWNQFVRLYAADLSTLVYSSILTGTWDAANGTGGGNTWLSGIFPIDGGLIAVGWHEVDEQGVPKGNPIPTANLPGWGVMAPAGESAIFAHLRLP
jgi:hypothetical protein